jgi:FkbM family methyltransferase
MTDHGLIVDVGMHDGSDTEFYLSKGFSVIAVEANPELVRRVSARLAAPIREGRLVIHETAVGDTDGTVDFYVSDEDLWASMTPDMSNRGIVTAPRKITVPCTTLERLLADCPTPHYIKIDVEGADPYCIEAVGRMRTQPQYLSFEADLTDREETSRLLDQLEAMGYRRFKFVNQATHDRHRLPRPALEGEYVDVRFGKHHSGPFGEETWGDWMSRAEVEALYLKTLRQQAARIEYSASGRVFGVPMSGIHKYLLWVYNLRSVSAIRYRWAALRGVESGGWFDIHASLGSS